MEDALEDPIRVELRKVDDDPKQRVISMKGGGGLRILAFETSAKAASVALLNDGGLLAEYYQNSGQTHSRTVMKMAEDLLGNCDLTVEQVDAVAGGSRSRQFYRRPYRRGGSQGVCLGDGSCLAAVFLRWKPWHGPADWQMALWLQPWMHAAVKSILLCSEWSRAYPNGLMEDSAISLEELCKKLQAVEGRKILVGDGAQLCYNTIGKQLSDLCLMPGALAPPTGHPAFALAAQRRLEQGIACDGASMTPSYLAPEPGGTGTAGTFTIDERRPITMGTVSRFGSSPDPA